jgi:hypothetical protein
MKRLLSLAVVITLGLTTAALAQTTTPTPVLRSGTPVEVVGQISTPTPSFGVGQKPKIRVDIGPDRLTYTLHLRGAQMYDASGAKLAKSDFKRGWWVRAEGSVLNDPRRIKVAKLQVIGPNTQSFRESAFFRPGLESGYVEAVAGMRQVFPPETPAEEPAPTTGLLPEGTPVVLVGEITGAPPAPALARAHKMQVAIGPDRMKYTLHYGNAPLFGPRGVKYTTDELKNKMWVRAEGTVMNDPRRIKVTRLDVLGRDWSAYHDSPDFHEGMEQGYIQAR